MVLNQLTIEYFLLGGLVAINISMLGKQIGRFFALLAFSGFLSACNSSGGDAIVDLYPFKNVYGETCYVITPMPGCTFYADGSRADVTKDLDYKRVEGDKSKLNYVTFDANGVATVHNPITSDTYTQNIDMYEGWKGGNFIGPGDANYPGIDVSGKTYYVGMHGVLYDANPGSSTYGKAINNQGGNRSADMNFSETAVLDRKALIAKGADRLQKITPELKREKAVAIANAIGQAVWTAGTRGYSTEENIKQSFQQAFGVSRENATQALLALQKGDNSSYLLLLNRSADHMGLKPMQAKHLFLNLYGQAMQDYGIHPEDYDKDL